MVKPLPPAGSGTFGTPVAATTASSVSPPRFLIETGVASIFSPRKRLKSGPATAEPSISNCVFEASLMSAAAASIIQAFSCVLV